MITFHRYRKKERTRKWW